METTIAKILNTPGGYMSTPDVNCPGAKRIIKVVDEKYSVIWKLGKQEISYYDGKDLDKALHYFNG